MKDETAAELIALARELIEIASVRLRPRLVKCRDCIYFAPQGTYGEFCSYCLRRSKDRHTSPDAMCGEGFPRCELEKIGGAQ